MIFISFFEIVYILITVFVVGYILLGLFPLKIAKKDVLERYTSGFDWDEYFFVCLVAAPAIILHELAHKFTAIAFGLHAVFNINTFGLFLGVLLKVFGTGFILLAPAYVSIQGMTTHIQVFFTSFAGPFINLLLWLGSIVLLKSWKHMSRKQAIFLSLNKELNKWLFIFNMLPIPPLDGYKVWYTLFQTIF